MKELSFSNREHYAFSEMKSDLEVANDIDNPNRGEALEYVWGDITRHFNSDILRETNRMAGDTRGYFQRRNKEFRSLCWNNPYAIDENDGEKIYYLPINTFESMVYYLGCLGTNNGEMDESYLKEFKEKTKTNPDYEMGKDMFELMEEWGLMGVEEVGHQYVRPESAMPGLTPLDEKELHNFNQMGHQC